MAAHCCQKAGHERGSTGEGLVGGAGFSGEASAPGKMSLAQVYLNVCPSRGKRVYEMSS